VYHLSYRLQDGTDCHVRRQAGSLRAIARRVLTVQGVRPSYITVRRRLREVGLKRRAPKPKPLITGPHLKLRLAFAQRHANDDWRSTAFHDEKLYLRSLTKAVWRMPHVKQQLSVNAWGALGRSGLSPIVVFDGILTAAKLREILEQHVVPNLVDITGEPKGPYRSFHDNDLKYQSATVTALLHSA